MGLIRSSLIFVLAVGLFIALFAANLFLTLNWSLEYSHVSPYIQNISSETATTSGNKAIILRDYESKKFLCEFQNESTINFTFEEDKISVPCAILNESPEYVANYVINKSVDNYYYKDYNCTLLDCLEKENQPLAMVSQNARDYWKKEFYSTIIISLVIFGFLFLFVREKHSAFILGGIITIFSAIPFRQITYILSLLPNILPFKVIPIFFSESGSVFILMLVLGIILFSIGIGIRFFDWGIKLNNFVRKKLKKSPKEKEEKNSNKNDLDSIIEKKVKEELKKERKKNSKSK